MWTGSDARPWGRGARSERKGAGESYWITPKGERLATRQPIDLADRELAEREYDNWTAPLPALALPAGLDGPL